MADDPARLHPLRSAVYDAAYIKAETAAEQMRRPLDEATLDAIATDAEDADVKGVDAKKDPKTGKRIQQGIGSPGHETTNHFASILRYEGPQKHQAALRKIWAENPERAKKIGLEQPERLGA